MQKLRLPLGEGVHSGTKDGMESWGSIENSLLAGPKINPTN